LQENLTLLVGPFLDTFLHHVAREPGTAHLWEIISDHRKDSFDVPTLTTLEHFLDDVVAETVHAQGVQMIADFVHDEASDVQRGVPENALNDATSTPMVCQLEKQTAKLAHQTRRQIRCDRPKECLDHVAAVLVVG